MRGSDAEFLGGHLRVNPLPSFGQQYAAKGGQVSEYVRQQIMGTTTPPRSEGSGMRRFGFTRWRPSNVFWSLLLGQGLALVLQMFYPEMPDYFRAGLGAILTFQLLIGSSE